MASKFDAFNESLSHKKRSIAAPQPQPPEAQPVGRPRNGKRSNANYTRLTVLVPEADVTRMKRLLLDEGQKRNMSDYIAAALSERLNTDTRNNGHTK